MTENEIGSSDCGGGRLSMAFRNDLSAPAALREKDNLRPFCELHRYQGSLDVTDASYHVQPSRGFNFSVSLCCTNGGTSPSTDPPNLKTSRTSRELR